VLAGAAPPLRAIHEHSRFYLGGPRLSRCASPRGNLSDDLAIPLNVGLLHRFASALGFALPLTE
jgi:hypothetical protein